jgi:hypothetical protein
MNDPAEEVEWLRQRVTELEEELAIARAPNESSAHLAPREQRENLDSSIEFMGDFADLQASGVDLSKRGLCLEVGKPLPFDIKLNIKGQEHVYRGHMAWMKSLADGSYRLGFQFVPPDLNEDRPITSASL